MSSTTSTTSTTTASKVLSGKIALVTGASRGIGAAIARSFAAAGADVAFSYSASKEKADEVLADIKKAGVKGVAIKADHSKQNEVVDLVNAVVKQFGRIDILVNNAGILVPGDITTPERSTEESITATIRMFEINVHSMVTATRIASSYIPSGGRIINIGSIVSSFFPVAGISDYGATKAAQVAYTKGWARDFAKKGITVNLIQPGNTDTDANPATGGFSFLADRTPVGRFGRPEEIASVALFLASPQSSFVNAAGIIVDGGITA